MKEINVNITEEFDTFTVELEADFSVYPDTYGEDADGNRGETILCADLKNSSIYVSHGIRWKLTKDELDEIEDLKESMLKDAEKEAVEKYEQSFNGGC